MKSHPYADLFPMMTAAELDALAADVAEHGLRQPIVRYKGEVLDGRNRLLACERAGVEPTFTDYEGDDPLGMVISLNAQRRDLTAAQRAIVAARTMTAMPERRGRPKKDAPSGHINGQARGDVASIFKVGKNQVQQAKALLDDAPDLIAQVDAGALSLAAAYDLLQQRRREAAQKAKDAERVAEFKDAVSSGEMTLDDALQKAIEQERQEREIAAAQADSRRQFLKGLAETLGWVERFLTLSDDHLTWNTAPEAPGSFDHGITAERAEEAARHLHRLAVALRGQEHGKAAARGTQRSAKTA